MYCTVSRSAVLSAPLFIWLAYENVNAEWIVRSLFSLLKGAKILHKPYICGQGGITAEVTVRTMLTTDNHGVHHWSRCHIPPWPHGVTLQVSNFVQRETG